MTRPHMTDVIPTDDEEDQAILEAIARWREAARSMDLLTEQLRKLCRNYGYARGYRIALSPEQVRRLIDDKHKRERMQ